ncbi:MAG: hypothetical protein ACRD2X_07280 [Vicinamibacteraceae bacterium]
MANHTQRPDVPAFNAEDEIDQVLGKANPNPDRVGCPPRGVLIAFAQRERRVGDPMYDHLIQCSPCYREFRAIQEGAVTGALATGHHLRWWAAAAAVVIFAAGLSAWFVFFAAKGPTGHGRAPDAVLAEPSRVHVDLRKHTVSRSAQGDEEQPPVVLPRGLLNMTILLPVGAEPGAYEIRLVKGEPRSQASAKGRAEIRNGITTLQATIDLRSGSLGQHYLALRRSEGTWHFFPATVK